MACAFARRVNLVDTRVGFAIGVGLAIGVGVAAARTVSGGWYPRPRIVICWRLAGPGGHGDGLDLDELARPPEHGDSEQGARRVVIAEGGAYHLPDAVQVASVG